MTWLALITSFALGIAAERARARYAVRKASRSLVEFRCQLGNPLDLSFCHITGHWQARG
jgi:hypothetical protein